MRSVPLPPVAVLARCRSAVAGLRWFPVAAGGFSGAAVWRGEAQPGEPLLALKAWPAGYPADRLLSVHRWMTAARQSAGLGFVPAVVPTRTGDTSIDHGGRLWDVTGWVPGSPVAEPSDAHLAAAMAALAALHRAWEPAVPATAPCPAAVRRIDVLERFLAGRIPLPPPNPVVSDALDVLHRRAAPALAAVRPFAAAPVPLRPCLRDVWGEHVLFTGDRVTGVIDYGAMGPDHPAADVARLLGDWFGPDRQRVTAAVDAYRSAGGADGVTAPFVLALAEAGLLAGVVGWLDRLASGLPAGVGSDAVSARLRRLLDRLTRGGAGTAA